MARAKFMLPENVTKFIFTEKRNFSAMQFVIQFFFKRYTILKGGKQFVIHLRNLSPVKGIWCL